MTAPKRIQRKRTKGWKMPPNTVYVGRPSKWGNPLYVNEAVGRTREKVLAFYREYIQNALKRYCPNAAPQYRGLNIEELRGKDLACWCPLCDLSGRYVQCHADVLLAMANDMTLEEVQNENLRRSKGKAL